MGELPLSDPSFDKPNVLWSDLLEVSTDFKGSSRVDVEWTPEEEAAWTKQCEEADKEDARETANRKHLLNAAEYVRINDAEYVTYGCDGAEQLADDEFEKCAKAICEDWQKHNLPDDDEMINDPEWLRSVGFTQDGTGMWNHWSGHMSVFEYHQYICGVRISEWSDGHSSYWPCDISRRGDLRTLARLVGFKLEKENPCTA